jgi:mRNA interferase MazF
MKSIMTYKKWDIVLVSYPFTNLQTIKKRPGLIISPDDYNAGDDIVILFITSNFSSFGRTGDYIIQEWKKSGLPKPSITRMKFATIEKSIVIKKIGRLHKDDCTSLQDKLNHFFG